MSTTSAALGRLQNRGLGQRYAVYCRTALGDNDGVLHALHRDSTCAPEKTTLTSGNPRHNRILTAQSLGQFIEQPVQIFVGLTRFFDLVHRVQDRGVVLATELTSDFRQRRFRKVFR